MVDETDFGHMVGEVEREMMVDEDDTDVMEISRRVDGWVRQFMELYPWAFSEEEAVGKLSAWFALKKKEEEAEVEAHDVGGEV